MEQLLYLEDTIDLDPDVRDAWGLPAPRLTYACRRPNELKRVQFLNEKVQEIGRAMGASKVWTAEASATVRQPVTTPVGTRMGSNPSNSVVNKYGQSWDVPNLFVVGSSTYPTIGAGFNTTLTIQALAYMTADALANNIKNPGQLL